MDSTRVRTYWHVVGIGIVRTESFPLTIRLSVLFHRILRGDSINTTASDVYSFGMVLFEVYSRQDPYEGENIREVLRLIADPVINKRPRVPKSCPPKIQTLMSECLDADPEKRPTFEELDLQLKRLDVAKIEPGQTRREKLDNERTKELLYDVFPKHVAEALRAGRQIEPESRDIVTIFFSEVAGYSSLSSILSAMKVADMLQRLYDKLDVLTDQYGIFKVETIDDAYLCVSLVGGLVHGPCPLFTHVVLTVMPMSFFSLPFSLGY